MSNGLSRKRAIALKAADARALIKSTYPYVLDRMTPTQVQQVQKVLDAAVVNPAVEKEAKELDKKSIVAQSGNLVSRNPDIVARANRVMQEAIVLAPSDKYVRLDYEKLLAPDAFQAKTDNRDEVQYLAKIQQTLKTSGVYLEVGPKLLPAPNGGAGQVIDPRVFGTVLTLGIGGAVFRTKTGKLDREALLDNTTLGAGYYREVVQGGVVTTLEEAMRLLRNQISNGLNEHELLTIDRRKAGLVVRKTSDGLGGADFPSETIWDVPRQLVNQANATLADGKTAEAAKILLLAAYLTGFAAEALAKYTDAAYKGAGRAVKILAIVTFVGKIADSIVILRLLMTSLVRLLTTKTVSTNAVKTGLPVKNRSSTAFQDTHYRGPYAFEETLEVAQRSLRGANVTGGTTSGFTGARAGGGSLLTREQILAREREIAWGREARRLMKENPNATLAEKEAIIDKVDTLFYGQPLVVRPPTTPVPTIHLPEFI